MSAYKQFTTKDIVITPFSANKGFRYTGNAMTASNVGVEVYFGTQPPTNKLIYPTSQQSLWQTNQGSSVSGSQNATGFVNKLNTNSVYSSAMQLYYSNYFGSMSGSLVATSSLILGLNGPSTNPFAEYNNLNMGISGSNDIPVGAIKSPQYDNYLSSTTTQTRAALIGENILVESALNNNYITAISIPSKLWGNNIEPQSFSLIWNNLGATDTATLWDDGNGEIRFKYVNSATGTKVYNQYCGNIIYEHGMAILTPISQSEAVAGIYQTQVSCLGVFILTGQNGFSGFGGNNLDNLTIGWSSSVKLYEHQYKCVVRENEYGYSLNPSLISSSAPPIIDSVYEDFVTGSFFSPYITTVGLYDNDQNLLAIGKLSVPTKVPMNADLEIQVSFDTQ